MDNTRDAELAALSTGGDAHAFERLVNRHYTTVYRLSYKWCGVKEDAEDITQEVFVKVAGKLKRFGGKSSFKTWLYRITVNAAKDHIRKQAAKRTYEKTFAKEHAPGNPNPSQEAHVEAARLMAAIGMLPDKQKAAVLLVFSEGLSHGEAARVLGCPETTVSWRVFQARKKLRKHLGRES